MIAIIAILPIIAAMLGISLVRGQSAAKYIAAAGTAAALATLPLISFGQVSAQWFSIGSYAMNLTLSVTPLNFLLLSVVLLIGLIVNVYSWGYMDSILEQRRYYLQMLAFEAAMAVFSVSGNFIVMFIAWEFLSLTSYLLIGFWYQKDSANLAARKALTMVFIGDLALLGAIAVFWHTFGTLEFSQIISAVQASQPAGLYAGVALLLVAVFSKSAQFPFQEWLIDAMEGPTPVSAYLHSSTMVKAGVFVAILLYPLFSDPGISAIVIVVGLATAVISTLAAARETHIKKVMAYSTVQELSIILVAVGFGEVLAAVYFFFAQSFYKALLFFSSGVVTKATGKEQLDQVSGLGTSKLVYVSTLFGVLSLAGFVPFSGFFANEAISSGRLSSNLAIYAIMSCISMLTSFYIIRWFSCTAQKPKGQAAQRGYSEQPRSMVYVLPVLAAATLAASAVFLYIGAFLKSGGYLSYLSIPPNAGITAWGSAVFTALVAAGAVLGYLVYYGKGIKPSERAIDIVIRTRRIMNWGYGVAAFITCELSAGISAFDSYLNEGFDWIGMLTVRSGYAVRRASVGSINSYAMIFAAGMLVLLVSFYFLVVV